MSNSNKDTGINTITINDVEYIRKDSLASSAVDTSTDGLEYVIVRSRDQGVVIGYLLGYEGRVVRLLKARQVYAYDSHFVLVDLAVKGPRNASKCKFSCESVGEFRMLEACGIIPCSEEGGKALRAVPAQTV